MEEDKYQTGLTKLFFRAGMLAYLENLRSDRLNYLVTVVQKNVRRKLALSKYSETKSATTRIQGWWRVVSARRLVADLRRETAAVKIQSVAKGFVQRRKFVAQREAAVKIQSRVRGFQTRRTYQELRHQSRATTLQSLWRGLLARRRFAQEVRSVVLLQSCQRRKMARGQLKALKVEARSATKLKEVSYKLENKVVELTQTLQRRTAEKKDVQSRLTELEEQQAVWTAKHDQAEAKAQRLHAELQKPTVPQERFDELLSQKASLDDRLGETLRIVTTHEQQIAKLADEVAAHLQELEARQRIIDESTEKAAEDERTVASLRSEVSSLRETMNRSDALAALNRNAPQPGSPSLLPNGLRPLENGSGDPNLLSPTKSPVINGNGSRRHSAGGLGDPPRAGDDALFDGRRNATQQNRAVSVAAFAPDMAPWNTRMVHESPAEEMMRMLEDGVRLDQDYLDGLIRQLKIVMPTLQNGPYHREVVFPAHLIGVVTNEMWKFGLIDESERFLANVMQTIQQHVMVSAESDSSYLDASRPADPLLPRPSAPPTELQA